MISLAETAAVFKFRTAFQVAPYRIGEQHGASKKGKIPGGFPCLSAQPPFPRRRRAILELHPRKISSSKPARIASEWKTRATLS
jgi:hypothetical protein